jgi:hypothetical protein
MKTVDSSWQSAAAKDLGKIEVLERQSDSTFTL